MTGDRILFVCTGNVCRSPYMALRFEQALEDLGMGDSGLTLSSRGAHVGAPAAMCRVASAHLHPSQADAAGAHTAVMLHADDVEVADLILTASRADRAAVALARPDARGRTFTLLEASMLGGQGFRPSELRSLMQEETSPLRAYARVLHERRGTLAPTSSPVPRGLLGRRETPVPMIDLPDSHHQSSLAHRRLFKWLDRELATLADGLRTVLDEVG